MKTMLEVCMYSGMCNWDPRCELTEEQTQIITEKANRLHKKATANRFGTGVLGADSFMVSWGISQIRDDGFEVMESFEEILKGLNLTMIRALPGRITVYRWMDGESTSEMYEDTENMHSFLSELAQPAIEASRKRAEKQMEEYIVSQFPYVPPSWEPNF